MKRGRAGGRAGVRYVITKFSRMDSLPNFVTHGAPLRARFARARAPLSWESEKTIVKFHLNCENTGKILKISCVRCHLVKFDILFLGLP